MVIVSGLSAQPRPAARRQAALAAARRLRGQARTQRIQTNDFDNAAAARRADGRGGEEAAALRRLHPSQGPSRGLAAPPGGRRVAARRRAGRSWRRPGRATALSRESAVASTPDERPRREIAPPPDWDAWLAQVTAARTAVRRNPADERLRPGGHRPDGRAVAGRRSTPAWPRTPATSSCRRGRRAATAPRSAVPCTPCCRPSTCTPATAWTAPSRPPASPRACSARPSSSRRWSGRRWILILSSALPHARTGASPGWPPSQTGRHRAGGHRRPDLPRGRRVAGDRRLQDRRGARARRSTCGWRCIGRRSARTWRCSKQRLERSPRVGCSSCIPLGRLRSEYD